MKSRFVVSYGDIALLVDTSPRRVGTVMATRGGEVSWWRVTNRNGELPAHLLPLARKQWRREGIAHTERRCDFERHRMEPGYLAALFGDALGEFIS
ncbi:MGMT family protein [Tessaracoccus defluvii]|uniref:MGMT family protein n=1 Tax=Tessaracoccus defluvii TaxID=1285901 RepID=UPI001D04D381|nr:MGMT family protein [Tessaracoccus defluvii]